MITCFIMVLFIFQEHAQTPELEELSSKFKTKMEDLLFVEDDEEDLK